jgi:hypothetical protein
MAKEITYSISIQAQKGSITGSYSPGQQNMDMATSIVFQNVQSVQNAVEAILLGDLTAPKVIILANQDATKTVDVYLDVGGTQKIATLPVAPVAGQGIPMSILCAAGVTYYLKASASSADVSVFATG